MADFCEGPLKQQCLGESGLFRWEDKHFRLHMQSAILEVFLRNEETKQYETEPTLMSFVGAKHAKEWSISTPTIGSYGFDVVWDSGRIWSFLAEDMPTCRRWVQSINAAITSNPVESSHNSQEQREEEVEHDEVEFDEEVEKRHQLVCEQQWAVTTSTTSRMQQSLGRTQDPDATHLETHSPGLGRSMNPLAATKATTEKYRTSNHDAEDSKQHQKEHQKERGDSFVQTNTPSAHDHMMKIHHSGENDENVDDHSHENENETFNVSAIPLVPSSDGSPESTDTNKTNAKVYIANRHVEPFSMNDTVGFEYSHDENINATKLSGHQGSQINHHHSDKVIDENVNTRPQKENYWNPSTPVITGTRRVSSSNFHYQQAHDHFQEPKQRHDQKKVFVHEDSVPSSVDLDINQKEIQYLKRQHRQAEVRNEELQYELESMRQQLLDIKEDSSRRCRDLEEQLAQAHTLQAQSSVKYSQDVEQAVIRAQVESQKLYELSSRSLKEQTQRELRCLQDELVDERKRYGTMLLQEKKMRSQADTKESELRIKYSSLVDKHSQLEKQLENTNAEFRAAKLNWERERKEIERANESRLEKIIEEKDQFLFEAQELSKKKLDNMTVKLNKSIKDMEGSVQDSCRQAFQSEKMLALAAAEKRYSAEIQKVRLEERKKAELEMNALRDSFVKREQETVEDLHSLEKLHQEQYQRLENEIKMYQTVIRDNEMSWEDTKTEHARVEELKRRQTEAHLHTVREHVQRAERMERQLQEAHSEVQHARAEESKYREQLARALEESKIQRAEYISLQRQCENDAAMANSWRTASKESELSLSSYDTSLKIAREELLMVERNYARVSDENTRLKEALQYADKVVYGAVPQHILHALHLENRVSGGGDNSENRKRNNNNSGHQSKKLLGSSSASNNSRHCWIPTYL